MRHAHAHRAERSDTRPYSGPVSDRQNPAAHGNVCVVAYCRCGAWRSTNQNQGHTERGPWCEPVQSASVRS